MLHQIMPFKIAIYPGAVHLRYFSGEFEKLPQVLLNVRVGEREALQRAAKCRAQITIRKPEEIE